MSKTIDAASAASAAETSTTSVAAIEKEMADQRIASTEDKACRRLDTVQHARQMGRPCDAAAWEDKDPVAVRTSPSSDPLTDADILRDAAAVAAVVVLVEGADIRQNWFPGVNFVSSASKWAVEIYSTSCCAMTTTTKDHNETRYFFFLLLFSTALVRHLLLHLLLLLLLLHFVSASLPPSRRLRHPTADFGSN